MKPQVIQERNRILAEMDAVIREIESVGASIQAQKGIGAERCVSSLYSVANKYRRLRSKLGSIN